MMTPTEQELADIERRLTAVDEHATEGPWVYLDGTDSVEVHPPGGHTELVVTVWGEAGSNEEGALGEFIAHARSDVRTLLAEVRAQAQRIAELEGSVTTWKTAARRLNGELDQVKAEQVAGTEQRIFEAFSEDIDLNAMTTGELTAMVMKHVNGGEPAC